MAVLKIGTLIIGTSSIVLLGGGSFLFREQLICPFFPIEQICETRADLKFRAFTEDGSPLDRVEITIDIEDEDPIETSTDTKGFAKASIPVNKTVEYTASKKGYEVKFGTINSDSVRAVNRLIFQEESSNGGATNNTEELTSSNEGSLVVAETGGSEDNPPSPEIDPPLTQNDDIGFLVKDVNGKPIKDTEIEFVFDGGVPVYGTTNTDGFVKMNLKLKDSVEIDIRKEGYERLTRTVDISNTDKIIKINLKEENDETSSARKPGATPIDKEQYVNPRGYLERTKSCVECDLVGEDLSKLDLMRVNLEGARLVNANLSNSNLTEANLKNAILTNAKLRSTNLIGANLTGANLNSANLVYATLADANLNGANTQNANFDWANLCGATLWDGTIKTDCD